MIWWKVSQKEVSDVGKGLKFKRKKSLGNPLVVTLEAGKWSDTPGCEFPRLFLWLKEKQ